MSRMKKDGPSLNNGVANASELSATSDATQETTSTPALKSILGRAQKMDELSQRGSPRSEGS